MAREWKRQVPRERMGVVLAALGVWVIIVVVGAGRAGDDSLLGVANLGTVWMIMMVLAALVGIVLLVFLNPFSNEWVEPDRQRGWGVFVIALLGLALLFWDPDIFSDEEDQEQTQESTEAVAEESEPELEAPDVVAEASDLLLLILGVGAVGGAWYLLRRRATGAGVAARLDYDEALEVDLVVAMEQANTELVAGSDPRTAVLNAYAVLEGVLATHGSRRERSETPAEHMRRSLQRLRIDPVSLIQLGELYEVARFSQRTISTAEQQTAAQALERARAQLALLT